LTLNVSNIREQIAHHLVKRLPAMTLFLTNAQFILLQVILKQKTQTISPKNADGYNNRSITKAKVRALKSS
jgi:hypothetical protein